MRSIGPPYSPVPKGVEGRGPARHWEAIEIMLSEYQTLRRESLQAITSRNQVLAFSLAAIAVVLGAGLQALKEPLTPSLAQGLLIVFLFAVPAWSLIGLAIWLGEAFRMSRVGRYMAARERVIDALWKASGGADVDVELGDQDLESLKSNPIYWEAWLRTAAAPRVARPSVGWRIYSASLTTAQADRRTATHQMVSPYVAVIGLYEGTALVSFVIGLFVLPFESVMRDLGWPSWLWWFAALWSVIFMGSSLVYVWSRRHMAELG